MSCARIASTHTTAIRPLSRPTEFYFRHSCLKAYHSCLHAVRGYFPNKMKTLNEVNQKLEKARAAVRALDKSKKAILRRETVGRLVRAQKKAKYRIGDILVFGGDEQLLVTHIGCYTSGHPWYGGLQIVNGKLTRIRRSTEGWGNESEFKKIGDCSMLFFQNLPKS